MVAGNTGRAALYPEFMNYRPPVRWGDPGRLLGDGLRGARCGEPGPVRYDRRRDAARPAGRTARPAAPGLGKLFLSLTGLAAGVFI